MPPLVLHLNHQTRGEESDADARFVADLARSSSLPCQVATLGEVEGALTPAQRRALPNNPSARYRAARLALFRQAADRQRLDGVLLAHHADDQAETVLLRLLRGSGYAALAGMAEQTLVQGVRLVRPLLAVPRDALREHLLAMEQPWREDSSNASADYARNRVRQLLKDRPTLTPALLRVATACRQLTKWVDQHAPALHERFAAVELANLPNVLAAAAAARWLHRRGTPIEDLSSSNVSKLIAMCRDAATPARQSMAGDWIVRRRQGVISADEAPPTPTR